MTTAVSPSAFLDEYTSFALPFVLLLVALLGLITLQVLSTVKFRSILWWLIPIFLGIAGGFSSLACMTYYSSFNKILENNTPYLTVEQLEMAPNFGAYEIVFIFMSALFFSSLFVSFLLAVIKAIKNRNSF